MRTLLSSLLILFLYLTAHPQSGPTPPVSSYTSAPISLTSAVHGEGGRTLHRFELGDSTFLLDGKPFQMISGEMHYGRVPREAWRQRMKMAKAMGLNTIGTYVFWNLQEPEKGRFDFTGNNDIAEFVRIAQQEGLWVVLRPSPYVCAEWEYGGYPYWLQNEKGLVVRSTESTYLQLYKEYIKEVGRQLSPLLVNHGGNILMVQIENEYGSYGSDSVYLAKNRELFREAGFDGLLYTCDPPQDLPKGHLTGLLPAVNGTANVKLIKALVNRYHDGKGPYYVSEWYPAWFDWWGEPHHTVPAERYTGQLDTLLANGLSLNMYMFHGGTTRGFMNGANAYDTGFMEPQVSSYDYDAPLDEAGNATAKFMAFRKVIQAHLPAGVTLPDVPAARPVVGVEGIKFTREVSVFSLLAGAAPVASERPLTFEALHHPYGYVLYRTTIKGPHKGLLRIDGLRDYAIVFIDGRQVGVLDRRKKQDSLLLDLGGKTARLDILVENLGRVNFGPNLLKNFKGITGKVEWSDKEVLNWQMYTLPALASADPHVPAPGGGGASLAVPVLKEGSFSLDRLGDTYLDMHDWGKGVVWINGHNLGRYWRIGPQQTICVPAEWLKQGQNNIVVFEMLKPGQSTLNAIDHPILDRLQ